MKPIALTTRATLVLALSLGIGCLAQDAGPDEGRLEQASGVTPAAAVTGNRVAGVKRRGVTIADGQLLPTRRGGAQPQDATGLFLAGKLLDGQPIMLLVEAVARLEGHDAAPVWAYRVAYTLNGDLWASLCSATDNLAVVIEGRWDYQVGVPGAGGPIADADHFTFACREAPVATCVELGYAPWRTVDRTSLRDHHAACVRMLRADYCGDGTAWLDGAGWMEVADDLGLQQAESGWDRDATWNADGATCARPRAFEGVAPGCYASLVRACDAGTDEDALLTTTAPAPRTPASGETDGPANTIESPPRAPTRGETDGPATTIESPPRAPTRGSTDDPALVLDGGGRAGSGRR